MVPIGEGTFACCVQLFPFSNGPSAKVRLDWLIMFFTPSSGARPPAFAAGPTWRSASSNFCGTLISLISPRPFTFKMNGRGEISEIKVPQKLLDALRQVGPAANAGGLAPEEGVKNMISQSSLTLAEGPLENGKSWTQQAKVPSPVGTLVMDRTYTFDGPSPKEAGLLQISVDTKVTLEPAADSNVAVKITSQKTTGEFEFDPHAGRVVSSRVNDKLQMSLSVMGQDLEQSTDTVTSMTLAKDGSSK